MVSTFVYPFLVRVSVRSSPQHGHPWHLVLSSYPVNSVFGIKTSDGELETTTAAHRSLKSDEASRLLVDVM